MRLWNVESGKLAFPPLQHRAWFTPDGQRIVTLEGFEKNAINIRNATVGGLQTKIETGKLNDVTFSSDAQLVATAGTDQAARVWNLTSGEPETAWLQHIGDGSPSIFLPTGVTSVAFSRDGLQLVTGSADGTLRIWEVETGLPLTPFIRHCDPIQKVAFDPTGTRIRVLSSSGHFSVWSIVPDDRPIEKLVRLTQMLGGRKLDDTGDLIGLPFDAFLERWKEHPRANRLDNH